MMIKSVDACVALSLAALLGATACSIDGPPPGNAYEARAKEDFIRDRDRCRAVAERTFPYVNPRNGDAVADRSYRVEGEIQKCMLSRGWNNPEFDGWQHGRY
jgi:hypothetical protein